VLLNESSYKYQILIIAAVLALGTAAVYWPVHGYGFVNYDDVTYVVSNPQVQAGLTLAGLKWASTTFYASNWHPLTWLSLMADVQLFGLNPGPHHIINVVLHILNAWLLFLVLTTMTEALWPSAIVAGLFAWHPLHVQSVAWIAERKDVLSTFFGLLALLAYTRYAKSNDRKWLVMAFFSFAFSLMAKPMLVTLPFVFLLTDFWPLKRTVSAGSETRPLIGEKLPFFLLSGVSSIVTFIAQRNGGEVIPVEKLSLYSRFTNAAVAYWGYLRKTFVPTDLAVIYPIGPRTSSLWLIATSLALLLTISILVICFRRSKPWLLVGWFWFLGMLVPVIGLVQVGNQEMADRYSYLPIVGIFIALVWSMGRSWVTMTAAVVVLGTALIITSIEVRAWRDTQTLFEHAVADTNENYVAHTILGGALADRGRNRDAEMHFQEALRVAPNWSYANYNFAVLLKGEGRLQEAQRHFMKAVQAAPDWADPHRGLASVLVREGKFEEAMSQYEQLLAIGPDASVHYGLGTLLMKLNRPDDAITHFAEAVRLNPSMAEAQNNWGYVLISQGRLKEAATHFDEALRINPNLTTARLNAVHIREELAHQ